MCKVYKFKSIHCKMEEKELHSHLQEEFSLTPWSTFIWVLQQKSGPDLG